jgi:hypothetical protein
MRSRGDLQGEAGAGVHHRRAPCMDCRDDLLGGDSLQIGAGRRQVRVTELTLDQRQRDPLAQQLHSGGMAQLIVVPTSAQDKLSSPLGVNVPPALAIAVVDMSMTNWVGQQGGTL